MYFEVALCVHALEHRIPLIKYLLFLQHACIMHVDPAVPISIMGVRCLCLLVLMLFYGLLVEVAGNC